jgi:hypothetical protein
LIHILLSSIRQQQKLAKACFQFDESEYGKWERNTDKIMLKDNERKTSEKFNIQRKTFVDNDEQKYAISVCERQQTRTLFCFFMMKNDEIFF